ncbi:MAG: hypothetical protein KDK70_18805, partial [Myxococcales bacterium]|nr:hypothetical protein [Myxococcales bacterium]
APDSSSGGGLAAAVDDEYFWVQGPASLDVDAAEGLLANDAPGGGVLLVGADVQSARGGTIATEPGGGFTYEAPAGFWGVDGFSYTIEDDAGNQSMGAVTIHVRPVVAPIAALPTHEAGFTILGKTAAQLPLNVEGRLGGDLYSVGDWDGDGVDDLGVVANHTSLYGEPSAGTDNEGPVYVVLGGPYAGDPDPSDLDNNQGGFAIQGPITNNADPATVVAGDWNGDGLRDLAITAPFANLLGAAYVLHGNQTTTSFSLVTWDFGADGFTITSFSRRFAGVGDLTGDGRDELAFGGCSVILGADEVTSYSGNALPAGVGFSITGHTTCFAEPLADVDGDGLPELLMYAYDDPANARAYVMWSQPAPTDATFDSLVAVGDGYYVYDSGLGNFYGDWRWVSGGGDVDGDGRGDLLIDADNILAVAYGKDTVGSQNAVDFYGGVGGFRINTPGVPGGAARIVGDVNGDGRADLLVVRQELDRAYVLYGGPAAQRDLPGVGGDGLDGFVIDGIGLGARLRTTSGDWNGDGLADVAFGAQDSLANRGAVHVVYGVRTQ